MFPEVSKVLIMRVNRWISGGREYRLEEFFFN